MAVPLHHRSGPAGLSDSTHHDLGRTGSLAAAAIAAGAGFAGLLSAEQALGPLVVALLVGLPHGAVDHLIVARRMAGRVAWMVGLIGYAGAAVAIFLALQVVPLALWSAFLALSAWHFGTGDREHLAARGPRPSAVWGLAIGLVPVATLMVAAPPSLSELALALHPSLGVLLSPAVTVPVAALTGLAVLVGLVTEASHGRWAAVVDLVLIISLFAAAPPLWAFGTYFGLWHAVRHVDRLLNEEAPWADVRRRGGTGAALRSFARDALPPTAAALLAGALLLSRQEPSGGVAATAVALQVTAALTFPHAITVAWQDRRAART